LNAAYARKEIHAYPYNGHEGGDAVHVRRQLDWLAGVFGPVPG
jgi:cephalosporin-C deacetylase